MQKLLWKEWHEQSWKLGFGCLVLGAFTLIGLRARIILDQTMIQWACIMAMGLLPILSSTGLVPAERASGSFESLLALPVSPLTIFVTKTGMGMLVCAGPLFTAAAVSLLIAGNRELTDSAIMDLFARSTLVTLSLFIWMMALSIRIPSEARAALLAMGALIIWVLLSIGLAILPPPVPRAVYALSPFACLQPFDRDFAPPTLWLVLVVQTVVLVLVWLFALRWLSPALEGEQ